MALSSEAIVFGDTDPNVESRPSTMDDSSAQTSPLLSSYSSGKARALSAAIYHVDDHGALRVRANAAEHLEARLAQAGPLGRPILFGLEADPYSADELGHRVTRQCLEVCLRHHVQAVVITRSPIIERDLDVLRRLAMGPGVSVAVGLTLFDGDRARAFEPHVSSPQRRIETIGHLARAHVPTVLSIAPAIWGLTDTDLVRLLSAAAEAGAKSTYYRRLALEGEAAEQLVAYVRRVVPDRAKRVASGLRSEMGPHAAADAMKQIVEYTASSLGLELLIDAPWRLDDAPPRPVVTRPGEQLALFDAAEDDGQEEHAPPLPMM